MDAKAKAWGAVGVLLALFGACSSEDGGGATGGIGGEGPQAGAAGERNRGEGGSGGEAGGRALAGSTASGDGGTPADGMAGNTFAGAGGCSIEDECGGCEPGRLIVKCSWGDFELPQETHENEACAAAAQLEEASAGGAGGQAGRDSAGGQAGRDSAGGAGGRDSAGDASLGICATYVAPGTWITSCGGCTEKNSETKFGKCVLRDECCVLVLQQACGI